jgi:hypothetical protein
MRHEVILNLWYCRDREGIIYSLRAKPYVHAGTDPEKLAFLEERAMLDYLIAEPFEVPERFHITVAGDSPARRMPVGHVMMLETLDSAIALFEDAIKAIEARFPAQSNLDVPQAPLCCSTPLMQGAAGTLRPSTEGQVRFSR